MGRESGSRTFLVDRWIRDVQKGQGCGTTVGWIGPTRIGMVTYLLLPQGVVKRPAGVGAGAATFSQEGCPGWSFWCFSVLPFRLQKRKEVQEGSVT